MQEPSAVLKIKLEGQGRRGGGGGGGGRSPAIDVTLLLLFSSLITILCMTYDYVCTLSESARNKGQLREVGGGKGERKITVVNHHLSNQISH